MASEKGTVARAGSDQDAGPGHPQPQPQAHGSGARGFGRETLCHPNRSRLLRLDQALRPLPQDALPGGLTPPGTDKVELFLSDLAVNGHVAASTQNQAFNALLFLYGQVLPRPFENVQAVRADRPVRVPVVLTPDEVKRVLAAMTGTPQLVARLLYGSGLRLLEALRLRVQDLDFEMRQVTVRDGKGAKDRYTVLSESLIPALRQHLDWVQLSRTVGLRSWVSTPGDKCPLSIFSLSS